MEHLHLRAPPESCGNSTSMEATACGGRLISRVTASLVHLKDCFSGMTRDASLNTSNSAALGYVGDPISFQTWRGLAWCSSTREMNAALGFCARCQRMITCSVSIECPGNA